MKGGRHVRSPSIPERQAWLGAPIFVAVIDKDNYSSSFYYWTVEEVARDLRKRGRHENVVLWGYRPE